MCILLIMNIITLRVILDYYDYESKQVSDLCPEVWKHFSSLTSVESTHVFDILNDFMSIHC